MLRGIGQGVAMGAALLFAQAPASGTTRSQGLRLSATGGQLLQLAERLIQAGDLRTARTVLAALVNDPSGDIRNEARFRLAKLEINTGNLSRAAVLLREVIDERPDAAPVRLELAGVLDRMGDKEGAWRQIRALRSAGLPLAVARLVDRYSEALRAQRPFGFSVEVAVAPDSNINRATRSDTLGTVFGDFQISADGKAKSGTGVSLHAQAYRRLPLGTDASLLMRVSGAADLYRASAFNDIAVDVAAGPDLNLGRDRLQIELGATQRWFGQKPFMRSERLAATLSRPLGGRTLIRLNGSAALLDNQRNDLEDGKSFSGEMEIEHSLTPTTGLAATFGVDRQDLKDPGYSTFGWRAGATAWRDIGRMTLTIRAEVGRLHADERLSLFPCRRADRYSRLTLGATFRQLQWRGFAPVARLSIERNRSTVGFYDYRRTRTELGFVHAF